MGQSHANNSISHFLENRDSKVSKTIDLLTNIKMRIPYLWEKYTGQNMNYYYA
jgi:hypothetical protein